MFWGSLGMRREALKHAPELENVRLTEPRIVEQTTVSRIGEV